MKAEIARLAPRKDATNIYALGIAGWAEQDVFIKELEGGLDAIASVLPIKDRTVKLINNRATLGTAPLADPQNFTAAVHAIGGAMNKDQDVLVLFMTSHGEQTGFALQVPGKTIELTPQQVAAALDGEGDQEPRRDRVGLLRWDLLPPLANDTTIVLTAADATHTSFGCAPERDWTYFGDAFFRQSLHRGADFGPGLQSCPRPDPRLGNDGPRSAVESAGAFRPGFGRQARAVLCRRAKRGTVTSVVERGRCYATSLTRPQAFSEAHKPRSRRKRSSGAEDLMARMR